MVTFKKPSVIHYTLFFLFSVITAFFSQAQKQTSDSLKKALLSSKNDTNRVNLQNAIALRIMYTDPDSALKLSTEALKLSHQLNWETGSIKSEDNISVFYWVKGSYNKALVHAFSSKALIDDAGKKGNTPKKQLLLLRSNVYGHIGLAYMDQSKYEDALDYFLKAYNIKEKYSNELETSNILNNIAIVYQDMGNYPASLEYYFKALRLADKYKDLHLELNVVGNIGSVYLEQGDYIKALEYCNRGLKLAESCNDRMAQTNILSNIGIIYNEQADSIYIKLGLSPSKRASKAAEYFFRSLKMAQATGYKGLEASALGNIAEVYIQQKDYEKALMSYNKVLTLFEELDDKSGCAQALGGLGGLYTKAPSLPPPPGTTKKGYDLARDYLERSRVLNEELGAFNGLRDIYNDLKILDSINGNYTGALENYRKYIAACDSVSNEQNVKKQTMLEMNYEFGKKEAETKAAQEKKDAVTKIVIYSISIGLLLVLVFSFFIFRGYKQKQKVNRIITKQKEEVEEQKNLVEEKQKEIIDSINYARRIQMSLLPTGNYIERSIQRLQNKNSA